MVDTVKGFSMAQKITLALDLLFRAVKILFNKKYTALLIDKFFENHIDSYLG
jgi:hypothetical protein